MQFPAKYEEIQNYKLKIKIRDQVLSFFDPGGTVSEANL